MHPETIDKATADTMLIAAGLDDGRYFAWPRNGHKGQYVLSFVFKGKPTHHLVSPNEDGQLQVNKRTFGGHTSIESLVKVLGKRQQGWPVALSTPLVNASAAATASSQQVTAIAADADASGTGGNNAGTVGLNAAEDRIAPVAIQVEIDRTAAEDEQGYHGGHANGGSDGDGDGDGDDTSDGDDALMEFPTLQQPDPAPDNGNEELNRDNAVEEGW